MADHLWSVLLGRKYENIWSDYYSLADVNQHRNICASVSAPDTESSVISGISGEGQMQRQNRMEVTPPPAHAYLGQTKTQIMAQCVNGRGFMKQG